MSKKIIECVPNISEGRDEDKIRIISKIVEEVDGVKLLNVDPGKATNRTVITFVGEPQQDHHFLECLFVHLIPLEIFVYIQFLILYQYAAQDF